MSLGLAFWICMLVGFLVSAWFAWPNHSPAAWGPSLFVFLLLFLLGWAVFGAPIR